MGILLNEKKLGESIVDRLIEKVGGGVLGGPLSGWKLRVEVEKTQAGWEFKCELIEKS